MKQSLNRRNIILLVLFLVWVLGILDKVAMNVAIIPISKELHLTPEKTGLLLSSFFLGYGIMQLVGGWMADKFGPKKVLTSAIGFWSLFTALMGAVGSYSSMIITRLFTGVGEGGFPPSSMVTIANEFPKEKRARAQSVVLSASPAGLTVGSLIAASLLVTVGWRMMFVVLGVMGIIIAVLVWRFLKLTQTNEQGEPAERIKKVPIKDLLKSPLIWKLLIIFFLINIVFWGLQTWMPSYWVNVRHMNMVAMGAYSAIPSILGFIAFILNGWILDKFMLGKEKYLLIISSLFTALFLYLMFSTTSIVMGFTYLSVANFFINITNGTVVAIPLKNMSKESLGTVTGMIYCGGQIGGLLSPTIMGFLIGAFNQNYNAAFMFLVLSAILVLIISLTINTNKSNEIVTNPASEHSLI